MILNGLDERKSISVKKHRTSAKKKVCLQEIDAQAQAVKSKGIVLFADLPPRPYPKSEALSMSLSDQLPARRELQRQEAHDRQW